MRDDKGEDDKIVAVAVDDPAFSHYRRHDELPPHLARELMRFFSDYKALEGKRAEVEEMYDVERALTVIEGAVAGYRQKSAWTKG
jgi:inorganic pyrophosphatase